MMFRTKLALVIIIILWKASILSQKDNDQQIGLLLINHRTRIYKGQISPKGGEMRFAYVSIIHVCCVLIPYYKCPVEWGDECGQFIFLHIDNSCVAGNHLTIVYYDQSAII